MNNVDLKRIHEEEVSSTRENIKNHIDTEVENYNEGMIYAMEAVPMGISFFTRALALTYDKEEDFKEIRLGINLITNGTHVHDDIIGYIKEKEGSETIWKKYGLSHGVNIGDGLLMEGFSALANADLETGKKYKILKLASEVLTRNFRGQAMNINLKRKKAIDKEHALEMLGHHVGSMGELMFCPAGILGNETEENIEILKKCGNKLAVAWQIARDADLKEEEIREGKRTFPVIKALKSGSKEERETLITILNKPHEEVTDGETRKAIKLIKKNEGKQFAIDEAAKLMDQCKKLSEKIEDKEQALKKIIKYARKDYFSVPV